MITSLLTRALPFLIALILGTGLGSIFGSKKAVDGTGPASSYCAHKRTSANRPTPLRILSGSEIRYIPEGSDAGTTGVVRLLIRFNPDGTTTVIDQLSSTLPDHLTEEAIRVAWQTRFIPATLNGQPVAETRVMKYAYTRHDDMEYGFIVSDDKVKTKKP